LHLAQMAGLMLDQFRMTRRFLAPIDNAGAGQGFRERPSNCNRAGVSRIR
jgi:hypothetical protein